MIGVKMRLILIINFNKNSKSEVKVPQECKKSLKRKKNPSNNELRHLQLRKALEVLRGGIRML